MPPFVFSTHEAPQIGAQSEHPWYLMWLAANGPHHPHNGLQTGQPLYWFDPAQNAIVWRSQLLAVEKFWYTNHAQVQLRVQEPAFQLHLGNPNLNQQYFHDAPQVGHFTAFMWGCGMQMHVPAPPGFHFAYNGWSDLGGENCPPQWQFLLEHEGSAAVELAPVLAQAATTGEFDPANLDDERQRVLRAIVRRRGRQAFRNSLIVAYGARCAVTGCDAEPALEAAHLHPYCGPQSDCVPNGLLLRSDIHTLYDLHLIGINPQQLTVAISPFLLGTCYAALHGTPLTLPDVPANHPNAQVLAERWNQFLARCNG